MGKTAFDVGLFKFPKGPFFVWFLKTRNSIRRERTCYWMKFIVLGQVDQALTMGVERPIAFAWTTRVRWDNMTTV